MARFICDFCGKEVNSEKGLASHLRLSKTCSEKHAERIAAESITEQVGTPNASAGIFGEEQSLEAEDINAAQSIAEGEDDPESRKKSSQPYSKDAHSYNDKDTFRRQNLLSVELKDKSLGKKWSSKQKFSTHLGEGWEPALWSDVERLCTGLLGYSGQPLTATVEHNGMILLKGSKKFVASRNKYFKSLQISSKDLQENTLAKLGPNGYGELNSRR
jgi:hypothetical protein